MNEARKGRAIIFSKKPPIPIIPRSLPAEPILLDFDALEIARQLTLIESQLYRAIKPWECLGQAWAKKDKEKRAPRVLAMINRFNAVSNWFGSIILQTPDIKDRVTIFKHIIEIAHHCLGLNNFNGVMEVISGLQASSVYRLKQTRSQIGTKHAKMLEECETVMCRDQNFKNFRAKLHSADPPSIPYLGVYLTDLTFIEDGNSDLTGDLINFVKRQQVSGVIQEIQQYQHAPYCLEKVDFIEEWLLDLKYVDEDEAYKLSMTIEPRGYKAPDATTSKRKISLTRQNSSKGSGLLRRSTSVRTNDMQIINNPYKSPYGEMEHVKGYLYYEEDNPDNIIIETHGSDVSIKAGTLVKLVERLTHEKFPDPNYMSAFLMTFRGFTTPNELLDLLINRFKMPQPKAPTKEQAKNFRAEKLIPIHFRVFNVLKEWTTNYGIDFRKDTVLVQRVLDFANSASSENSALESGCKIVIDTISKSAPSVKEPKLISLGSKTNENNTSFLDIDHNELCNQINAFIVGTYCNVEPREYINCLWDSSEGRFQCIHLHRLYKFSNNFIRWMKTELFTSPDVTKRALVLSNFILMADIFSKLKNKHCSLLIVSTLEELREKELQITWEWLSPRYLSIWSRLQQQKSRSEDVPTLTRGRSATRSVNQQPPPPIPYLIPIFEEFKQVSVLPDLVNEELINFEKRMKHFLVYVPIASPTGGYTVPDTPVNDDIHKYLSGLKILNEEEIPDVIKKMNNERPEGLPPSEQKNDMHKIDSSIDESIKPLLLQLLTKDKQLQDFIIEKLSKEIQMEAVQHIKDEMKRFATIGKLLLSLVSARKSSSKNASKEILLAIARTQFPNCNIETWTKLDTEGSVYGWEEEISLVLVESEEEKVILDAHFYAKKADISNLIRRVQFYQEENDDESSTTLCSLIVSDIDGNAKENANTNNIKIIKI